MDSGKGSNNFLIVVFTAMYFYIFLKIIDLVFRHGPVSAGFSIFTIVCWVIAFIVSVGLSVFTEKKIAEWYRK